MNPGRHEHERHRQSDGINPDSWGESFVEREVWIQLTAEFRVEQVEEE